MKVTYKVVSVVALAGFVLALVLRAEELVITPALQSKIDDWKNRASEWADEAVIRQAVEEQNKKGPIDGMTEEKWKNTRRRDAVIAVFQKNPAAELLATKMKESGEAVSEAFLSASQGEKVAFVEKTTSYVHKGKPKFDVPFTTSKAWQGKPEFDESSQTYAIQISVPVLADKKPIGVLVVGLSLSKLQSSGEKK